MSNIAVRVEDLWKKYRLGRIGARSVLADLKAAGSRLLGRHEGDEIVEGVRVDQDLKTATSGKSFWALREVNLELKQGTCLGIVGRNGAGKSTLLKLISRISSPTRGEILIRGKVTALLEVGLGFNSDMTGRENVFYTASMHGMSMTDTKAKLDEIVEFAGIADFFDTPIKHYSTGMKARLAMSVASSLESDILILDEVLAVGDISFQKKSMERMSSAASEGRAVIFVSHSLPQIRSICDRVIHLDGGRVVNQGEPEEVIEGYSRSMGSEYLGSEFEVGERKSDNTQIEGAECLGARLRKRSGEVASEFRIEEEVLVEITYKVTTSTTDLFVPSIYLHTTGGVFVLTSNAQGIEPVNPGIYTAVCPIQRDLLNGGTYVLGIGLQRFNDKSWAACFTYERALGFTVMEPEDYPGRYSYWGKWHGAVRPALEWKVLPA